MTRCIHPDCTRETTSLWLCGGPIEQPTCMAHVEYAIESLWGRRNQAPPPPSDSHLCHCDCGTHLTIDAYADVVHVEWHDDASNLAAELMDVAETHGEVVIVRDQLCDGYEPHIEESELLVAFVGLVGEPPAFTSDLSNAHDQYLEIEWSPAAALCTVGDVTYVRYAAEIH